MLAHAGTRAMQHCLPSARRLIQYRNPQRLYSVAIAREIPDSFVNALDAMHAAAAAASPHNDVELLSMERAREQHVAYVQALRSILPVILLPALPDYPDCCFIEDTVVAIGNRAVVTRLGHVTRQGEVDSIRTVLQQLGVEVTDMRDHHQEDESTSVATYNKTTTATCDGGDVLYTGRHLFVGLSQRTNLVGAQVLEQTFGRSTNGGGSDSIVEVGVVRSEKLQGRHHQALHLKSAITHINEHTLLAPTGELGDELLAAMQATERGYKVYRLPNLLLCNVVACNGVVLAQDNTGCMDSRRILEEAVLYSNMDLMWVDTSELAKKDAALTCCSVLLNGGDATRHGDL